MLFLTMIRCSFLHKDCRYRSSSGIPVYANVSDYDKLNRDISLWNK